MNKSIFFPFLLTTVSITVPYSSLAEAINDDNFTPHNIIPKNTQDLREQYYPRSKDNKRLSFPVELSQIRSIPKKRELDRPIIPTSPTRGVGTGPKVVHVKGGNTLLFSPVSRRKADPTRPKLKSPGSLISPENPVLTGSLLTAQPEKAWVYPFSNSERIIDIEVEGSGVTTSLVSPECFATDANQPPSEGNRLIKWRMPPGCSSPSSGNENYVRFEVDENSQPGVRQVSLVLQSNKKVNGGTITVARAYKPGNITQNIQYKKNDRAVLPSKEFGLLSKSYNSSSPPVVQFIFSGADSADLSTLKFSSLCSTTQPEYQPLGKNNSKLSVSLSFNSDLKFTVKHKSIQNTENLYTSIQELPKVDCSWYLYDNALLEHISRYRHKFNPAAYRTSINNVLYDPRQYNLLDPDENSSQIRPDFLILAGVGDSYGSGEGAPNKKYTTQGWDNDGGTSQSDCHRSEFSRLTQAAKKIAQIKNLFVVYRNFACSGATIDAGFINEYEGLPIYDGNGKEIDRQENKYQKPQAQELKNWLTDQKIRKLDALLVSFGGNEVGFTTAIPACVSVLQGIGVDPGCHQNLFLHDKLNKGDPAKEPGFIGFNNLGKAYTRFAQELKNLDINPGEVFINEYPTPLKVNKNTFCGELVEYQDKYEIEPSKIITGQLRPVKSIIPEFVRKFNNASFDELTVSELRWLEVNFLDRLHGIMARSAIQHGWNYVDGVVEHSVDRGYCTRPNYTNTFRQSVYFQKDYFGAVHPNRAGYNAYGSVLAHNIIDVFSLPPRPNVEILMSNVNHKPAINIYGKIVSSSEKKSYRPQLSGTNLRFKLQLEPTKRRILEVKLLIRETGSNKIFKTLVARRDPTWKVRTQFYATFPSVFGVQYEYQWQIRYSDPNVREAKTMTTQPKKVLHSF